MSAFVVGADHIDFIVTHLLGHGATADQAVIYLDTMTPLATAGPGWQRVARHVQHAYGASYLRVDSANATDVGLALWADNLASVQHRYPDTVANPDATPGPVNLGSEMMAYRFRRAGLDARPGEILAAADCLAYQSCEHPDWRTSFGHAALESLRAKTIRRVPGYADTWEWTRPVAAVRTLDLAARGTAS